VSVLQNAELIKYEDVVNVVCHTKKNHTESEVVVDPKKKTTRKSCEKYPSIECAAHDSRPAGLDIKGTPASFICGPDGAPLVKPDDEGGNWDRSVGKLTKKLQDVQMKLGRPMPRMLYDKILRDLTDADAEFAEGKYEKAVKTLDKYADDKKIPQAMKDGRLKERLAAFDAKGTELLEEAKSKRDSAADEALKLAKKVAKEFKGLESGKAAGELVKEWEAAGKS
jgi:hypothetical protein